MRHCPLSQGFVLTLYSTFRPKDEIFYWTRSHDVVSYYMHTRMWRNW